MTLTRDDCAKWLPLVGALAGGGMLFEARRLTLVTEGNRGDVDPNFGGEVGEYAVMRGDVVLTNVLSIGEGGQPGDPGRFRVVGDGVDVSPYARVVEDRGSIGEFFARSGGIPAGDKG